MSDIMKNLNYVGIYLVLIGLIYAPRLRGVSACPTDVCICKWKSGKQTVECGGQLLPNIPEGMDPGTQVLNFSGNSLQVLQSERFLRMDLLNLQKIYLSRNQLIRVHEKAFRGLSNLVELDLGDNALQQIPTETFQDYSSLMRLILSGNPIRELKSAAFRHLTFLTTLELSNCQIERIENEAFLGMDNLEWLRLDGNRLTAIEGSHILPKSLHGISLQSNRWTCDCHLIDVHEWLLNYHTPQTMDPLCVEPPRLKGQPIKNVKQSDLACVPEISTSQPPYLEVSENRNLTISCAVKAFPPPEIEWYFNGRLISPTNNNDSFVDGIHLHYYMSEETAATSPTASPSLVEDRFNEQHTEISIYSVGVEDNGTYTCLGRNVAGTNTANYTIRVIIKEPPVVNEVSFPQNYMNYIVASSTGGGLIFVVLLCTVVIKCKNREANGRKRKKCSSNSGSAIHSTSATMTTTTGSNGNDGAFVKCSSILNDSDSLSLSRPGLLLRPSPLSEPLSPNNLPSKENRDEAAITSNNHHVRANLMLYAPVHDGNSTLLSLNVTSNLKRETLGNRENAALLSPVSTSHSLAIRDLSHSSTIASTTIRSNNIDYCSPPSSLRNYIDRNPDLVNDAESGTKHKQSLAEKEVPVTPTSVSTGTHLLPTEYESVLVGGDCSVPTLPFSMAYDHFYQLTPQFNGKSGRTGTTVMATSPLSGISTLPRGLHLNAHLSAIGYMSSNKTNASTPSGSGSGSGLNCAGGGSGSRLYEYDNADLEHAVSSVPVQPHLMTLMNRHSHTNPLSTPRQSLADHKNSNSDATQQIFYRTLPHNHNRLQKQQQYHQQQQQPQQQQSYSTAIGRTVAGAGTPLRVQVPMATGNPSPVLHFNLETEFVQKQQHYEYEQYNLPNVRFTAEGYPRPVNVQQQYLSPPDGYKNATTINDGTNATTMMTQGGGNSDSELLSATTGRGLIEWSPAIDVGLQQWPPCLPGYHAQPLSLPMVSSSDEQESNIHHTGIINPVHNQLHNSSLTSHSMSSAPVVSDPGPGPGHSITSGSLSVASKFHSKTAFTSNVVPSGNQACLYPPQSIQTTTLNAAIPEGHKRKNASCSATVSSPPPIAECDETETSLTVHHAMTTKDNIATDAFDNPTATVVASATMSASGGLETDGTSEREQPQASNEQSASSKLRHLNGPLADSPDEGYVGDA